MWGTKSSWENLINDIAIIFSKPNPKENLHCSVLQTYHPNYDDNERIHHNTLFLPEQTPELKHPQVSYPKKSKWQVSRGDGSVWPHFKI